MNGIPLCGNRLNLPKNKQVAALFAAAGGKVTGSHGKVCDPGDLSGKQRSFCRRGIAAFCYFYIDMEETEGTSKDCAGLLSRNGSNGNPTQFEKEREELLAAWLGAERTAGVFADMRKPVRKIGDLMEQCLKKLNCGDMVLFSKVRDNWRSIVNSEVAARMLTPVSIRKGILSVEVANPSFQMAYRDPRIMSLLVERLKKFTGGEVTEIRFTAHGRNGFRRS